MNALAAAFWAALGALSLSSGGHVSVAFVAAVFLSNLPESFGALVHRRVAFHRMAA